MTGLLGVRHLRVNREIAVRGHEFLQRVGQQGLEGIVFWAGTRDGEAFRVCEAVVPEQVAYRSPGGVQVAIMGEALHRLNVLLHESGWLVGAQLHSHPSAAYHSPTDDRYSSVTLLGSLSIVVPDFAREPFAIARCAVLRLQVEGWASLTQSEATELVRLEG